MEDEAPVIYGLEFQARALAAHSSESETVRFLVGTQSLKFDNQIHQLEYDEENNTVNKTVFLHSIGEVWHIGTSPVDTKLISTCYNKITSDGKCEMCGTIWKLPSDLKTDVSSDDTSSTLPSLEHVTDLEFGAARDEVKSIIWEPGNGTKLVSLSDVSLHLWDLNGISKPVLKTTSGVDQKGRPKFASVRWNPHHNCNLVAAAVDSSVRSWDLRSMQQSWAIDNAHGQLVRELDFNPNKQYYLATCGDDCQTKFWDVRKTSLPLLILSDHSHWVWSVRYNNFHDQLVLTSSSDSRVILSRATSVSSEPFGHLIDDEEINCEDKDAHSASQVPDGVVSVYEEHEDSVYAAEWSTVDPWLFASLSYDGRLIINKVPRTEKYRILL